MLPEGSCEWQKVLAFVYHSWLKMDQAPGVKDELELLKRLGDLFDGKGFSKVEKSEACRMLGMQAKPGLELM